MLGWPSPGSGPPRTMDPSCLVCIRCRELFSILVQKHLHGDRLTSTVNSAVLSEQTLDDLPLLLFRVSILGVVYVTAKLIFGCLQMDLVTLKLVSTGTPRVPTRTPSGPTL